MKPLPTICLVALMGMSACRCGADETKKESLQLDEMPEGNNLRSPDDCGVAGRRPHAEAKRYASVPAINGPYVRVHAPGEDVLPGPDSPNFKTGQSYKEWVPNDHAIIKGRDHCWHAIGITHPKPPDFDPPRHGPAVHEAEWLFFHALSPGGRLKENLKDGSWRDAKELLTPRERPGENKLCYAPVIVAKDHHFHMIYGPNPMRLATSADLFDWKPCGPLFSDEASARDPNILFHDGRQDEDGDWFISSVEWPHRGLSIAPLVWKQQPVPSEVRGRLRR
jgi:hypothetical protein